MSKVEINFKIIHSTSSHTLLGGEINVTQPLPNSIICPPLCDFQENHITIDRTMYGSDQSASLEFVGMKHLTSSLEKMYIAMGEVKLGHITEEEQLIAKKLRAHIKF
jgi:hypothetical protein